MPRRATTKVGLIFDMADEHKTLATGLKRMTKRSDRNCHFADAKTLQLDLKLTVEPGNRGIPPGTAADSPKPPKGAKGDAYATAY